MGVTSTSSVLSLLERKDHTGTKNDPRNEMFTGSGMQVGIDKSVEVLHFF